jgi:hypothetical protein
MATVVGGDGIGWRGWRGGGGEEGEAALGGEDEEEAQGHRGGTRQCRGGCSGDNAEERRSRWWRRTEGKREGEACLQPKRRDKRVCACVGPICRRARPLFCQAERRGGRTTGWSVALTRFLGVETARSSLSTMHSAVIVGNSCRNWVNILVPSLMVQD